MPDLMAAGLRGIKRLAKREAGHLPIKTTKRGGKHTDAEHGLLNVSRMLIEEIVHEKDKPVGKRDYAKLIAIGRQLREWIVDMEEREQEAAEAAAKEKGPSAGDAPAAGGAEPGRVLGTFFGGAEPPGGPA